MIIKNRFLSDMVIMLRGLRQGYLLSLPVYVIQGEMTTQNINNDKTITGLTTPNSKKQLQISQYADDSSFFYKNKSW